MGKLKEKSKHKSHGRIAIIAAAAVIAVVLVLFAMPRLLYRLGEDDDTADGLVDVSPTDADNAESGDGKEQTKSNDAALTSISFPMDAEDGKLRIEAPVPFDGWNPDCGDQSGTNIASVVVTNLSDTYLIRGDISITTDNGEELSFVLTDIPAGGSAMAFDTSNATIKTNTGCDSLICQAEFDDSTSVMADGIAVSVNGSAITLQNNTENDVADIVVYCHGLLGDRYFGGITYTYTLNNLTAGGTAELDAQDCILGMVEVVRVTVNKP